MSEIKDQLHKDYNEIVKPKLEAISGYKAHNLSNRQIAEHLSILPQDFQKMVKEFPELAEAMKVGEDLIVDQAESALYKAAFKNNNVNAIQFILKKLAPQKWGDNSTEPIMEVPQIVIEMKDAKVAKKELDALVEDIAHLDKDRIS